MELRLIVSETPGGFTLPSAGADPCTHCPSRNPEDGLSLSGSRGKDASRIFSRLRDGQCFALLEQVVGKRRPLFVSS